MKELSIKAINREIPLRDQCVSFSFPKKELPITGGWGFSKESAIVIDKHDAVVPKKQAFNGITLEHEVIDKRIDLEFFHLQDEGNRYRDIHWKVEQQEMMNAGDRVFDKFIIRITALHTDDYKSRLIEWKENGRNSDFDKEWFLQKSSELTQYCYREFWFDITSFYGK